MSYNDEIYIMMVKEKLVGCVFDLVWGMRMRLIF